MCAEDATSDQRQSSDSPSPPVTDGEIDSPQNCSNADEGLDKGKRKPMSRFEVAIVILTAVGIVIGIATGVIFFGQFQEMIGQTDLAGIAARQTRRDSAESSVTTQKQLAIAAQQAKAAQDQALAARKAADTARDTLRMAYRPWLSAESVTQTQPLDLSDPLGKRFIVTGNVLLRNTGVSIARAALMMPDVGPESTNPHTVHTPLKSCEYAQRMQEAKSKWNSFETGFVLAPQATITIPFSAGSDEVPQSEVRRGHFQVYGCVLYSDQYGVKHYTQFCFSPIRDHDQTFIDTNAIKFEHCGWSEGAN